MKNLFEIIVLATIVIGLSLMIGESYDTESIQYSTSTSSYDELAEEECSECECECEQCYNAYLEDDMIPHCDECEYINCFTQEEIAEMRLNN